MKFVILVVFLLVAAVMSLPVEQPEGEAVAAEASPEQAQKRGADDLKAEETFWGGWGGRHYGGWGGGYYVPHYYNHGWGGYGWGGPRWHGYYPTTYYTSYWG